jgi:2-hydroxy-3-keto-5-methylthiopentenyl-1-phosphate phosphatase
MYRESSDIIIYIGDGQNDLCPAKKSNIIFARDALIRHCKQENIDFHRFSDFTSIQTEVMKIIEENND